MTTLKEIGDKYYQYCNVVMLPTNEKSNLLLNSFNGRLATENNNPLHEKSKQWEYQHIHITSNEEIKTGDWCVLDLGENTRIVQVKSLNSGHSIFTVDIIHGYARLCNLKKVIATTDKSLVVNISRPLGVTQELPQPPLQFIEKFIKAYNNNVGIDEVLVEYEKATYEKWIKNRATPVFDTLKVNSDNTINIKLIKESYTRAELIKLLNEFGEHVCNELLGHRLSMIGELNKWAEENL